MKKLFLTLIVAFATLCGLAQEKVLDNKQETLMHWKTF